MFTVCNGALEVPSGAWKTDLNEEEKSRIWETLNLSTCADSSNNTKKSKIIIIIFFLNSHVSSVMCHVSPVTNANSHSHRTSPG